jgi:SAM-dependent methyltransferase
MNQSATFGAQGAVAAFDRMASSYDAVFTESAVGRAQRNVVWDVLRRAFRAGDRVLELNCGTGEDALFLAGRGISVLACDASASMIEVARHRAARALASTCVQFQVLRNEDLQILQGAPLFDGALSNFSGLNCVADLRRVAINLGNLVRPGGSALLCLSTRICLWEIAWHGARAHFSKAFRRVGGKTVARLDGVSVPVWYPRIGQVREAFSPWFRLHSVRAVGLFVPPSYVERWAKGHRFILSALESMDRVCATWPLLRAVGDHVLLEFRRERLLPIHSPILTCTGTPQNVAAEPGRGVTDFGKRQRACREIRAQERVRATERRRVSSARASQA